MKFVVEENGKEVVYIHYDDLAQVLKNYKNTHVLDNLYKFEIYCFNDTDWYHKQFIYYSDPKMVELIKKADYLIDYDEFRDLSFQSTSNKMASVINDLNQKQNDEPLVRNNLMYKREAIVRVLRDKIKGKEIIPPYAKQNAADEGLGTIVKKLAKIIGW